MCLFIGWRIICMTSERKQASLLCHVPGDLPCADHKLLENIVLDV
jgi:hypothetical protein